MITEIDRIFREEHGRVVGALIRLLGDISLAEEAVQDAYVIALERWTSTGLPPNPGAWLTTTARNRAIDHIRRESTRDTKQAQATMLLDTESADNSNYPADGSSIEDYRLRLIFTCCHPALAQDAQVALTLRLLGGLTVAEIASAFLVDEAAMAKRLTRSKQKIKANRIPYRIPSDAELPDRLSSVLAALYLIFNEGYLPSDSQTTVRADLCAEGVRLARILVALMPDEPEAAGLLALMLLTEARRPTRFGNGELITLLGQRRSDWDADLIAEGHAIVRECLRRNRPGPYQIQACINAVHTDAPTAEDTDWRQIVALYDQLFALVGTPVVAMNRAIAVAEIDGPAAGLAILGTLDLTGYHALHAARAELLRRQHRYRDAASEYTQAIELAANPAEKRFLTRRRAELLPAG